MWRSTSACAATSLAVHRGDRNGPGSSRAALRCPSEAQIERDDVARSTRPGRRLLVEGVHRAHESAVRRGGEVDARIVSQQSIRRNGSAGGQRKDDELRRLRGGQCCPRRQLEASDDLDRRQERAGGDVEAPLNRAEQGNRHAALELAHDPGPVDGNSGDVLRQILMRAVGQPAVGAAGSDDEIPGPQHPVDDCIPPPQLVDARVMAHRHRHGAACSLRRGVPFGDAERRRNDGSRDEAAWRDAHRFPPFGNIAEIRLRPNPPGRLRSHQRGRRLQSR